MLCWEMSTDGSENEAPGTLPFRRIEKEWRGAPRKLPLAHCWKSLRITVSHRTSRSGQKDSPPVSIASIISVVGGSLQTTSLKMNTSERKEREPQKKKKKQGVGVRKIISRRMVGRRGVGEEKSSGNENNHRRADRGVAQERVAGSEDFLGGYIGWET